MKFSPEFRHELANAIKLSGIITGCVLGVLLIQSRGNLRDDSRAPASVQADSELAECQLDEHGNPIHEARAVPPHVRKPCRNPVR